MPGTGVLDPLVIDHTNLAATATRKDIDRLCREAVEYGFAAVCLNPWHVPFAAALLEGTAVKVAAVVGFPLGATTADAKVFEAGEAIQSGAREIDLVINLAALREGLDQYVRDELLRVRNCTKGALLKVILETTLLTSAEKRRAARLARDCGAEMVKTSTGYAGGATIEDVKILKRTVPELGIKASGGIRHTAFALALLEAGATRLGTSCAVKLMRDRKGNAGY
ncbi:MAG: Deoxyribose-phosphate aldolase [Syntrophomonadaceae bacterium]|nr:Deoxyribose-phosphate aldolase [Bacillota bacterium]